MTLRPAPIMKPQLIRFGSPRPRKDKADSSSTALATMRLARGDDGRQRVGQDIADDDGHARPAEDFGGLDEFARAQGQKFRADDAGDGGAQDTMAIATMIEERRGWKIATRTTARMKLGTVWKNSVTRMIASSRAPPL